MSASARPWLPVALERAAGKALGRYGEIRIAVEYAGRVYASDGRAAFLSSTRLRKAERRIAPKDAKRAFGPKRAPKAVLPRARVVDLPSDVRVRAEAIGGLWFDAAYLKVVRKLYGAELTYDIWEPEHLELGSGRPLRIYKRGVLVAVVTQLRGPQ